MPETTLVIDGEPVRFLVERDGEEWVVHWTAGGARTSYRIGLAIVEPGIVRVQAAGRTHLVHTSAAGSRRALHMDGHTLLYEVARGSMVRRGGGGGGDRELRSPMPGVVTQVAVREGEEVRVGQPLVIIEAMKMEHVVRANAPGVVRSLRVRQGEQVDGGTIVAEIAAP